MEQSSEKRAAGRSTHARTQCAPSFMHDNNLEQSAALGAHFVSTRGSVHSEHNGSCQDRPCSMLPTLRSHFEAQVDGGGSANERRAKRYEQGTCIQESCWGEGQSCGETEWDKGKQRMRVPPPKTHVRAHIARSTHRHRSVPQQKSALRSPRRPKPRRSSSARARAPCCPLHLSRDADVLLNNVPDGETGQT